MVQPLQQSLSSVDAKIRELELARVSAYSVLTEQVKALGSETSNLAQALRAPATRGRWGEIQLKRTVEMAGMVEHCDFTQQQTLRTEDGRLRPDLVVMLPNGRRVVVDAKVPLTAYLEALECDGPAREAKMKSHAFQVRTHVKKLAEKSYWAQFDQAPEFVVIFLPAESFFSAALLHDPGLIEYGVEQKVLLTTPTTLIALLKTVAFGWREERITQNALEISKLGKEIYERLSGLAGHFCKVGDSLERATKSYNEAVGALERRVLPAARKMKEYGATTAPEIAPMNALETAPRPVVSSELMQ